MGKLYIDGKYICDTVDDLTLISNPEQWKDGGNCKCCRRRDYCSKLCSAAKRGISPQDRTRAAVRATGNKWAMENFNATHG